MSAPTPELAAEPPTPHQVLALPLEPNDSGADTVRGYLLELLKVAWDAGDDLNPFGNSGWKWDLYRVLVNAGYVASPFDERGYVEPRADFDKRTAERLITDAITALRTPEDAGASFDIAMGRQLDRLRHAFRDHADPDAMAYTAWFAVDLGYTGMWATCDHLRSAYDSMSAEVERLDAEIAALRAGEDDTPLPDGELGTEGQWLYRFNRMTGDHRHQWLRQVRAWQADSGDCWLSMHDGQISRLTTERDRALGEVRELSGRPTRHAYEAACEALERRRVALVSALEQPEGTLFYDAVAVAGRLAGGAA